MQSTGITGGIDGIGKPFDIVCSCQFCELNIYDDRIGVFRCPICFGHLRSRLNIEGGNVGGFWGGQECQGVCGLTWTNLNDWHARATPDEAHAVGGAVMKTDFINNFNVPPLKTKEEYANRRPLILKARREGQTLAAIGNTWGITGDRVRQIIKEELRRRSRDT